MAKLTLSVVTPSYNQGEYVGQCIQSAFDQTHPALEHLIYDPGSKDNSLDVIRSFGHVTLINEPDQGQADAVSKGMAAAKGDIIAWLNSDDYYSDNHVFESVVRVFEENPDIDFVYSRGVYVGRDGTPIKDAYINSQPETLPWKLATSVGILQPATFFRRDVVFKIGVLDINYNFVLDYEYWIRAIGAGSKFKFLDRITACARYYPDNKTLGMRGRSYAEICDMVLDKYGFVPVEWIKRFAEFNVSGADGILVSGSTTPDHQPAILAETKRLLTAYNYGFSARSVLNANANRRPYATTVAAMRALGLDISGCFRRKPQTKHDEKPWLTRLVGDTHWQFLRVWQQQLIDNSLFRFEFLRSRIESDTCVIVGNGPSLNQTNLDLLGGVDTFISNFALYDARLHKAAKYFSVTNYLVAEEIAKRVNIDRKLVKFFPYWLSHCFMDEENTYFFKSDGIPEFSRDVRQNVSWLSTVSFFHMQIAFALGYRKVCLVGFDHSYQQRAGAPEGEILFETEDDPNHFSPTYFKHKYWQAADTDKMAAVYQLAKQAYERDGREIVNCTVGGRLEVFRRSDLETELGHPVQPMPARRRVRAPIGEAMAEGAEDLPRVLILDNIPIGTNTATGKLKETLFARWPHANVLQVYVNHLDENLNRCRVQKHRFTDNLTNQKRLRDEIDRFQPEVIYVRPLPDDLNFLKWQLLLLNEIAAPYVVHMMDDWPALLAVSHPSDAAAIEHLLTTMLHNALDRLSISTAMSAAYLERYGLEFRPIANGAVPAPPAAGDAEGAPAVAYGPDRPFIIRYFGGLSTKMNDTTMGLVAQAVGNLNAIHSVCLEIYTMKWYLESTAKLCENPGVSIQIFVSEERYPDLLGNADCLLICYNFDTVSQSYVRLSFPNKFADYLSAGAPILMVGPDQITPVTAIRDSGAARVVDSPDVLAIQAAILALRNDPAERQRLCEAGQRLAAGPMRIERVLDGFEGVFRRAAAAGLGKGGGDTSQVAEVRSGTDRPAVAKTVVELARTRPGGKLRILQIGEEGSVPNGIVIGFETSTEIVVTDRTRAKIVQKRASKFPFITVHITDQTTTLDGLLRAKAGEMDQLLLYVSDARDNATVLQTLHHHGLRPRALVMTFAADAPAATIALFTAAELLAVAGYTIAVRTNQDGDVWQPFPTARRYRWSAGSLLATRHLPALEPAAAGSTTASEPERSGPQAPAADGDPAPTQAGEDRITVFQHADEKPWRAMSCRLQTSDYPFCYVIGNDLINRESLFVWESEQNSAHGARLDVPALAAGCFSFEIFIRAVDREFAALWIFEPDFSSLAEIYVSLREARVIHQRLTGAAAIVAADATFTANGWVQVRLSADMAPKGRLMGMEVVVRSAPTGSSSYAGSPASGLLISGGQVIVPAAVRPAPPAPGPVADAPTAAAAIDQPPETPVPEAVEGEGAAGPAGGIESAPLLETVG